MENLNFVFDILYSDGHKSKVFRRGEEPIAIMLSDSLGIALKDAPYTMQWSDAKEYCRKLRTGFKHWRLPQKDELQKIYYCREEIYQILKAFNMQPFDGGWYWSSSSGYGCQAIGLWFSDGEIDSIRNYGNYSVRPVLDF